MSKSMSTTTTVTKNSLIPDWILHNLDRFGNSLVDRELVRKLTKEGMIDYLNEQGFPCKLRISMDDGTEVSSEFPKAASYVIEVVNDKGGSWTWI